MRFSFAILNILFTISAVVAQPPTPKKRALLVGVSTYQKTGLAEKPLPFAAPDMELLAKELQDSGWDVRILISNGVTNNATRIKIVAELDRLLTGVNASDLILVALSGHGQQFKTKLEGEAEPQEEAFFCPSDGKTGDAETLLGMTELTRRLGRDGGKNLVLVDACRDDPRRGGKGVDGNTARNVPNNTAILFSCAARQQSFETNQMYAKDSVKGHGVFFHRVWQGLKGAAKNERGEITWTRLVEYVTEHVNEDAIKWFPERVTLNSDGEKVVQTPHQVGSLVGKSPVLALAKGAIGTAETELPEKKLPSGWSSEIEVIFGKGAGVSDFVRDGDNKIWLAAPRGKDKQKLILMEDTDQDGRPDKVTTVTEELGRVTKIELRKGGVRVLENAKWVLLTIGDGKVQSRTAENSYVPIRLDIAAKDAINVGFWLAPRKLTDTDMEQLKAILGSNTKANSIKYRAFGHGFYRAESEAFDKLLTTSLPGQSVAKVANGKELISSGVDIVVLLGFLKGKNVPTSAASELGGKFSDDEVPMVMNEAVALALSANKHVYVVTSPEDQEDWLYKSTDANVVNSQLKNLMVWHGTGEPADFELFLKSIFSAQRGTRDISTLCAKRPGDGQELRLSVRAMPYGGDRHYQIMGSNGGGLKTLGELMAAIKRRKNVPDGIQSVKVTFYKDSVQAHVDAVMEFLRKEGISGKLNGPVN